jgi:hypothetical protein
LSVADGVVQAVACAFVSALAQQLISLYVAYQVQMPQQAPHLQ